MDPHKTLKIASIGMAIFWTLAMWWWNRPDMAGTIILSICGVLVGVLWYFAMRWWMTRFGPQRG